MNTGFEPHDTVRGASPYAYSCHVTIVLVGIAGVLIGAVLVVLIAFLPPDGWTWAHNRRRPIAVTPAPSAVAPPQPSLALAILDQLPTATVVLDQGDEILFANSAAASTGMVKGNRLTSTEMREQVRRSRRDGRIREAELELPRGEPSRGPWAVRARIVPVGGGDVAVIVDDLTESRRIDAVRRDFVANISHELKTPGRRHLAARGGDRRVDRRPRDRRPVRRPDHPRVGPADPARTRADRPVQAAGRRAAARGTAGVHAHGRGRGGRPGPARGPEQEHRPGLRRLRRPGARRRAAAGHRDGQPIDNAVAYSPENTRVAVAIRASEDYVEISVTDQGIGMAPDEVDRIFERFYRVDPARSRATGGTGLGLAIVKHIVTNLGGTIAVWSTPGAGSTFTVRLPGVPVPAPLTADVPLTVGATPRKTTSMEASA